VVACVVLAAGVPSALAQPVAPPPDAASAQADELTRRGVEQIKKHRWADAEAFMRQAWALKRSYDIAGNLGLAEVGLGKWRDAAEHLSYAVRTFPANGKAAHRELLSEKLAAAREQVAALSFEVSPAGAEVKIDGQVAGVAPFEGEVFVMPGARVIEATCAGREPVRWEVDAVRGASSKVTFTLPAAKAVPPLVVPPPKRSVVPGVVLASVGGAALAAGLGLVAGGAGKLSTSKNLNSAISGARHSCVAGAANFDARCTDLASASSAADTFKRAGLGLLAGGGVAAVGSAIYLLWPQAKAAPVITPSASASGVGFVVSGEF
jgi:hypothetical protein